jgi:peptide/nickel transport system substrate-binding protein
MLRDEGGVIVPMFNDYIDATSTKVGGWVDDGEWEMMGGYALPNAVRLSRAPAGD